MVRGIRESRPVRYPNRPSPGTGNGGDQTRWIRRRERFYEKALGPIRQPGVYHWDDDHNPHVDVYVFGASEGRAHEILITGGLADRPLPGVPPDALRPRRVELLAGFVSAKPWGAMILREIAALPFLAGMVLGDGMLIRGSRSIHGDSQLSHALLTRAEEPALSGFVVEGEEVCFLRILFITERELDRGVEEGGHALLTALKKNGVEDVTDLYRPCIFGG